VNQAEWVCVQGIRPQAAYRWLCEGTLPVPAVRVKQGTVLVPPGVPGGPAAWPHGLYARVSSYGRRADLGRRVVRLTSRGGWWRRPGRAGRGRVRHGRVPLEMS
jgi:predicted site-specific integrase-resolvase